jgi:hypothetical protein
MMCYITDGLADEIFIDFFNYFYFVSNLIGNYQQNIFHH